MRINNIPNNDKHEDHVDKLVTTSLYDKSYDKLVKDHKKDIVDDIDKTVDDLIYYRIDTQKSNHPLTNLKTNELHIRGNVLLLYKYGYSTLTISLLLIDLTDHKHLKNPDYQKQIKKTIKNLKENKGDKNMEYMEYITTNENTLIVSFKFKNKITGADTMFNYEVPFEVFIEAVKDYFDKHFDVVLKGKDKDIWNMLVDLGERVNADIIQEFIDDDEIIKELQDRLEKEAHEKFDELCQEVVEDDEDDKLDESYEDDEVTDDEISEALADYQWQITDSTTVGQYAQETADKLGCSKEQVLKVILNENPNIREDERMAKVAGLDDEEDEFNESLTESKKKIIDGCEVEVFFDPENGLSVEGDNLGNAFKLKAKTIEELKDKLSNIVYKVYDGSEFDNFKIRNDIFYTQEELNKMTIEDYDEDIGYFTILFFGLN